MAGIFFLLILATAMLVVAYLLRPTPTIRNDKISQGEAPTAEAGIPMPVLFGTLDIKQPNCLWYGTKYYKTSEVDA